MDIIEKLIEKKLIAREHQTELEREIEKTGKTPEELLVSNNIVDEKDIFEIKSDVLRIPLKKIIPQDIALDVLELIPEEPTANYKMIPLLKKGSTVEIGMVYPENMAAQDALRFLSRQGKFKYDIVLITLTDFYKLLKQHSTLKGEAERALDELEKIKKGDIDLLEKKPLDSETLVDEAPIKKMVLVILKHALEGGASDVHIEPGKDNLRIRFRIDGILHSSLVLPLNVHSAIVARIKIMSNLKIDESRIPQDGRFSVAVVNKDIDFRVSTYPTLYGEKVEIRILDPTEGLKSYEDLGLVGRNFEVIKEAIAKPYGMILATGPTGSGKTTTLYALLRILNKETVNIVTIEDPIEYSVEGVNQSQVKPEIGYNFASGLRQILRQDPNIIMVGEIRDDETAGLVTHAALTGHIVLSTLHTNSSIGAIPRLIDMGVKQFLLPYTLRAVISQRLVRTLCPVCKTKVKPSKEIKEYILQKIKNMPPQVKRNIENDDIYIFEQKGCEKCNFTGFVGRKGIFEVLPMSEELASIILKNPTESDIMKLVRKQGILTMEEEGVLKVLDGETTIAELTKAAEEK